VHIGHLICLIGITLVFSIHQWLTTFFFKQRLTTLTAMYVACNISFLPLYRFPYKSKLKFTRTRISPNSSPQIRDFNRSSSPSE